MTICATRIPGREHSSEDEAASLSGAAFLAASQRGPDWRENVPVVFRAVESPLNPLIRATSRENEYRQAGAQPVSGEAFLTEFKAGP